MCDIWVKWFTHEVRGVRFAFYSLTLTFGLSQCRFLSFSLSLSLSHRTPRQGENRECAIYLMNWLMSALRGLGAATLSTSSSPCHARTHTHVKTRQNNVHTLLCTNTQCTHADETTQNSGNTVHTHTHTRMHTPLCSGLKRTC